MNVGMQQLYNAACEHENVQRLQDAIKATPKASVQQLKDAIKVTQNNIKKLQNTSSLLCEEGLIQPHVYADIQTESNKFDAQLEQLVNPIPESALKAVFTSPLKRTRDTPLFKQRKVAQPASPVREHVMPRRLDFSVRRKKSDVGRHVRVQYVRRDLPAHVTPTASDLKSWTGIVLEVKKSKTKTHRIGYSDATEAWEYMPYLKRYNLVTFLS